MNRRDFALLMRRESLHHQALHAVHRLAEAYRRQGDFAHATQYALRLIELDPYNESHNRILMQVLAQNGQSVKALAHFDKLHRLLREELGAEPDAATTALAGQIRDGQFERTPASLDNPSQRAVVGDMAPPTTASLSLHDDWRKDLATGIFVGRDHELAQISRCLDDEGCRIIEILGLGGVGKSTLAAEITRWAHAQFDAVIWRSLVNAPALDELLASILRQLELWNTGVNPASPGQQLPLLLAEMHQRRVLLVLDNLESIMQEETAGRFRPDYSDYAQFLQMMAAGEPGSCLIVTSRERPAHMRRWEESGAVVSVLLGGLSEAAGRYLLLDQGIHIDADGANSLVRRCSGNPLALKLVSSTIEELFAGDIDDFLAGDTVIFDDIRAVLDDQFERLSPLEQSMLFRLAVAREAISAATLRAGMIPVPAKTTFLEALQNLQRRSLIERHAAGFTLQNVVLEYVTDRFVDVAVDEIHATRLDCLHAHALLEAQAGDSVRLSQIRQILAPVAVRLRQRLGHQPMIETLWRSLETLHSEAKHRPSYAAGNLLNLLLHIGADVTGRDFSGLCIRQADLKSATLAHVDFRDADLSDSTFVDSLGRILAVAVSPDGRVFATGGDRGQLRIWSLPLGVQISQLETHANSITSVAFSPDGSQLAAANVDGSVGLWAWQQDQRQNQQQTRLLGHVGSVHALAYHPTGTLLASGGQDRTVRLWRVPGGSLIDTQMEHASRVLAVDVHPDGHLLATGDADGVICLWTIEVGEAIAALHLTAMLRAHDKEVLALAFSPDGTLLASASADTTIRLWDPFLREPRGLLTGHVHWVRSLAFRMDSSGLFSGGADETVRVWDIATLSAVSVLRGHTHVIRAIAVTPDDLILVSGGLDDSVRLWDLIRLQDNPAIRTLQGYTANVRAIGFSPDGRLLASGDGRGNVRYWQVEHDTVRRESHRLLPGRGRQVNGIDFSPDGLFLAAADDDTQIRIWRTATGELVDTLRGHPAAAHAVRYTPDGKTVTTCSYDGTIYIWDVSAPGNGQMMRVLAGHERECNDLCITPDGRHLISIGRDHTLRLWDLSTGACKQVLHDACRDGKCLSLHPDGNLLAASGTTEQIALFSLDNDDGIQPVDLLASCGLIVTQVGFSPDGARLASAGEGGSIRLWNIADRQEIQTLHAHTLSVMSLAYSPNGRLLASGGMDETIRLWQPDSGASATILRPPGPYEGMNIAGATGITPAQRTALKALGAVELEQ